MDPHKPRTLREMLLPIFLIVLVAGGNAYALITHKPEQLSEVAATTCRVVPVGAMSNRACLGTEPKVVIWGDSQANAWIPMAQALGKSLDEPSTNLARDGCPPLLGAKLILRSKQEAVGCEQWNAEAIAYLRKHGADTLVIVARWRSYIQPGLDNGAAVAIARSVEQASPYVQRIVVIGPTPELAAHQDAVSRSDFEADAAAARAALHALEANPKVRMADPSALMCEGGRCPRYHEGNAQYSDDVHVSYYTAKRFGEQAARQL